MSQQPLINPQILYIIGAIVSLLIGVVGFFISFYFKRSIATNDKLNDAVNNLKLTVQGLHALVMSLDDKYNTSSVTCKEKHHEVNERFEKNEEKLERHDRDITRVKVKLKMED